ncbi:putative cysteine protease atg4 [Penicillium oxalicum]|uniref:putative cysteine protease atg4 n=1 Tax=Penicillium oxalicum TaxID=69781 RepID=UPI0020B6E2B0|nr:putative cysteine protease atg4 [Penicillium oxalicum]KAI2786760.1 putative cysteine protease atg4 [Penicillium oxalicum]
MTGVDLEKCKRIVQYFWDPEPKNHTTPAASIWCLGQEYTPAQATRSSDTDHVEGTKKTAGAEKGHAADSAWPEAFLADFESRIWMTYRSHFPPIPRSTNPEATSSMTLGVRLRSQLMDSQGFTSDTGWGSWRRGKESEDESKLLAMFADHPDAPFSIHRFVQCGAESCGKYPGEWFGPSATARCIQTLLSSQDPPPLRVYVTKDTSDVYEDQFIRIASDQNGSIQPTLILMGVRLGIDQVTSVYWDGLQAALQYPQSVGIAGGRPSASHYFVGAQDSHLFFLDPHFTRPALPYRPEGGYSAEESDTCHTRRLRRIHIKDMDPSMLIGFLIQDDADWTDWKSRLQSTPGKPIIHLTTGEAPVDAGHGRREALNEVEVLDDSDSGSAVLV